MGAKLSALAGRYTLERELAAGGMATVWSARDEVLARTVAVKMLHPHLADDAGFLDRFRQEAIAAARLAHPNIVSIFDTGEAALPDLGDRHYIVMEYCGRGSLDTMLREQKSLPPERVARIGATIAYALGYAHVNGVLHRDVKPGNVLISNDGSLRVGDFGIAKAAASDDVTTTGTVLGTVAYLSPEQAQGGEPDARSDIYGLGVLLYECLVGRPPFVGANHVATALMHVKEAPRAPRERRAGIPRALDDIVMTALAKDPADRFTSADEMARELEDLAGHPDRTIAGPPVPEREVVDTGSFRSETKWLGPVAAVLGTAVAAALLLSALFGSTRPGPPAGSNGDGGPGGTARVEVASVDDLDPDGGDGEHGEDAHLAADDDTTTTWASETYSASFALLKKSGVGLVFDLGDEHALQEIRVSSPTPGYAFEIRTADAPPDDIDATEVVASVDVADVDEDLDVAGSSARYWIVWITALPGGSGRVAISEVSFTRE